MSRLIVISLCAIVYATLALNRTEVISSYNKALIERGLNVDIYNIALSKLQFDGFISAQYDAFFHNVSKCSLSSRESILVYQFRIHEDDVDAFLETPVIKEMPQSVVEKLVMLKFSQGPSVITDSFARLYPDQGLDRFEIGHTITKVFYDSNQYSVLLLAPSLVGSAPTECLSNTFRKEFIGKAADIQDSLAIKAAMDKQFAHTLLSFNPENPRKEFKLAGVGVQNLTLPASVVIFYSGEIPLASGKPTWWHLIHGFRGGSAWLTSKWRRWQTPKNRYLTQIVVAAGTTVAAASVVMLLIFLLLRAPHLHPSSVIENA